MIYNVICSTVFVLTGLLAFWACMSLKRIYKFQRIEGNISLSIGQHAQVLSESIENQVASFADIKSISIPGCKQGYLPYVILSQGKNRLSYTQRLEQNSLVIHFAPRADSNEPIDISFASDHVIRLYTIKLSQAQL